MIYDISHNETRATKNRPAVLKGRTFTVRPAEEIPRNGAEQDAWRDEPGTFGELYVPAGITQEKRNALFAELVGDLRRILIDGVTVDNLDDDDQEDEDNA